MDKNELERRLEAAEKQNLGLLDEIKNLKEKLAEMQEIPDKPYFNSHERYWYVETEGSLVDYVSRGGASNEFNKFHSETFAQEFANKCKLIAMMLHCKWYLDRDYVPDWNNRDEMKFLPIFNNRKHKFVTGIWQFVDNNGVCFSTRENAQKCADWLNEHWRKNDEESV